MIYVCVYVYIERCIYVMWTKNNNETRLTPHTFILHIYVICMKLWQHFSAIPRKSRSSTGSLRGSRKMQVELATWAENLANFKAVIAAEGLRTCHRGADEGPPCFVSSYFCFYSDLSLYIYIYICISAGPSLKGTTAAEVEFELLISISTCRKELLISNC